MYRYIHVPVGILLAFALWVGEARAGGKLQSSPATAVMVSTKAAPQLVYVSDFISGAIEAFPQAERSQAGPKRRPVETIAGLQPTTTLFVDRQRNLYVPQPGSVLEFAPGASRPFKTFDDAGHNANGVALCPNGTLFVANSEDNTISVYAGGATEPTGVLVDPGQVFHLACDAASDIFVTVGGRPGGQVDEFLANGSGPINLPIALHFPEGIAVDRSGDVVVADSGGVAFYRVGRAKPFKRIAISGDPLELSFSQEDALVWVTGNGAAEAYAVRTGRRVDLITTIANPGGIAASPPD